MNAPWYTTPEALAIIDTITERPEVVTHHCLLGDFDYPRYAAPAALYALWTEAATAALHAEPYVEADAEAVMAADPSAVMSALFGSAGFLDDDTYGVWPTIRFEIDATRIAEAA